MLTKHLITITYTKTKIKITDNKTKIKITHSKMANHTLDKFGSFLQFSLERLTIYIKKKKGTVKETEEKVSKASLLEKINLVSMATVLLFINIEKYKIKYGVVIIYIHIYHLFP